MNKKIETYIICKTCKASFRIYPYRKTNAKYCSIECMNKGMKGIRFSKQTEFKKGRVPHNYKGIHLGSGGRYKITFKGKVQYAYRYLIEKIIKRKLKSSEHIHHKDNNKVNDLLDNYMVFNKGGHPKFHHRVYDYIVEKNLINDYMIWFKKKFGKCWKTIPELVKGGGHYDR